MSIQKIIKYCGYSIGCIAILLAIGLGVGYMNLLSVKLLEKTSTEENLSTTAASVNLGDPNVPVDTIYRGKVFFVHYRMKRDQLCNSEFNTAIRNEATGTSDLLRYTQNWSQVGDFTANELFEINKDLPKGAYTITKREIRHCTGITSYAIVFKVMVMVDDLPLPVPAKTITKPIQPNTAKTAQPASQGSQKDTPSGYPWEWHWFKSWK